jgi:membrane protease YdiL (CAAX protease family)
MLKNNKRLYEYLNILWLSGTIVVLIALQIKTAGFMMLAFGLLGLLICSSDFRRNIALVYGCAALLGITPINTDTNFPHTLAMGVPLFLVVFAPYYISKNIYKNRLVRFPFGKGREWKKRELGYVLFTVVVGFLILPPMLRSGNSYMNWEILPGAYNLMESYIGLNVVGIWDELFFISTVLGIFRRHLPFWLANIAQAVFFTSFLYTLGFQGWSPFVIFPFALSQGYIFMKTDSLLYVLTIHLTLDLVLHLALVYLHYPDWLPFIIT